MPPIKVMLTGRNLPRNESGDPSFENLEAVRAMFSDEEITALVNRQIYQMEYQREVHLQRSRTERANLAPIKAKFKQMYPKESFLKATPKQYEEVMKALQKESSEAKDKTG